jgi:hypothetical protein
MKFAKVVFWIAGVWGVLVLFPLYFMSDVIGRTDPPAITHLGYYFGFLNVTLAWQLAFFILARDPVRFRPMMIASIAEKVLYFAPIIVLRSFGLVTKAECIVALPDLVLAGLFTVAYAKARSVRSLLVPLAGSGQ